MMRTFFLALLAVCLGSSLVACSGRKTVWIYTSLSKDVIAEMVAPLEADVPEAEVKWFQSGSDAIEGRLEKEIEKGKIKADLVLSGDPLWFLELKREGRLLPYQSPAAKEVPTEYVDPDHAFSTARLSVMTLGYNPSAFKAGELPTQWKELASPKLHRKVSMANPLDSTGAFIVTAMLSKELGWEYFAGLHKQGLMAQGASTSVAARVDTEDRPLGILPIEAALRTSRNKGQLRLLFPSDGAIPVPGPIAILNSTRHPEVTSQVYDWFFSARAQAAIVRGGSYSPFPKAAPPEGAPARDVLALKRWSPALLAELLTERDRIRSRFSEVVLH